MNLPKSKLDEGTLAIKEVDGWICDGLHYEKVQSSHRHRFEEAMLNFQVILLFEKTRVGHHNRPPTPTFLIEHNWSSAFEGATDFEKGDYRLPFDNTCFEFKISGKHVIAFASEADGVKNIAVAVETDIGWFIPHDAFQLTDGQWRPALKLDSEWDERVSMVGHLVTDQIRAVCISLEAEATVAETVNPPEKLNKARER